jgi:hypothetical protein
MERNAPHHAAKKIGKLRLTTESAPAFSEAAVGYQSKISEDGLTTPGNPRKILGLTQFINYEQRRIIYAC